jgi:hypothetical protein
MTEWVVALTPLLVLPIVALFRFVGCGKPETDFEPVVEQVPEGPPRYRDYILPPTPPVENRGLVKNGWVKPKAEDVIAYWRLVDKPGQIVYAEDETGVHNGAYVTVGAPIVQAPSPTAPGSEDANPGGPGIVILATTPLIDSDPDAKSARFRGGFVSVPAPGLYTGEFTIEAWYIPEWTATGYEHTLVCAGVPASNVFPRKGFSLFVDRENRWRVRLAPTGDLTLDQPAPIVDLLSRTRTHIALTVGSEGTQKRVRLFFNGIPAGSALVGYIPPDSAENSALRIGIADAPDVAGLQAYRPFIGNIQEVVLHRKALTLPELENHVHINRPRPY